MARSWQNPPGNGDVKVLVVDDSRFAREMVKAILEGDDSIRVIGTAEDGKRALQAVEDLKPDLITMDINMPVMDGYEAIEQIMAYHPTPILVIAAPQTESDVAFRCLGLGALDVMEKPSPGEWGDLKNESQKIQRKIRMLAKVQVIAHPRGRRRHMEEPRPLAAGTVPSARTSAAILEQVEPPGPAAPGTKPPAAIAPAAPPEPAAEVSTKRGYQIIAIASSTGGPRALNRVLARIPADIPAGIVIVQHIADGFTDGLVNWLNADSKITVRQAEPGDRVSLGLALIAPNGYHLVVRADGEAELSTTDPVGGFRPSGDVLLKSVAEAYGNRAIGLILTGMGCDGAEGIRAISEKGGATIAQDEATSVIFGMPKAAIDMGAVSRVSPLEEIADEIMRLFGRRLPPSPPSPSESLS